MAGRMALAELLVMVGMVEENRMARLSVDLADRNYLLPALQRHNSTKDQTK